MVVELGSLYTPDGFSLQRMIFSPGRGVLPAVRMPERVKDWLAAGLALELARVMAVDCVVGVGVAVGVGAGSVAVTVMVTTVLVDVDA